MAGSIVMDDVKLRNVVADAVAQTHGNDEFIRQIREGEQDDGPFVVGAKATRDWFLAQLMPVAEAIDE